MFLNKDNYFYSLLLHLAIILLLYYFVEFKKPIEMYNQIINIDLQYIKPLDSGKTKKKNPVIKKINEESSNKKKKIEKIFKKENEKFPIKNKEKFISIENKEEKTHKINEISEIKKLENSSENKTAIINRTQFQNKSINQEEFEKFKIYRNNLKYLIQKKATENYPRISVRKNEQGIVDLSFSIQIDGKINNIRVGQKTKASKRLIDASINTLKLISPYEKNTILKKKNTFSIIIVYKLE